MRFGVLERSIRWGILRLVLGREVCALLLEVAGGNERAMV
jgi:hypothetical protein